MVGTSTKKHHSPYIYSFTTAFVVSRFQRVHISPQVSHPCFIGVNFLTVVVSNLHHEIFVSSWSFSYLLNFFIYVQFKIFPSIWTFEHDISKKKSFLRKVFYWKLNCCVDEFIFHDLMSHSGIVSPKRLYNYKVSTVYWNTMIKKKNLLKCRILHQIKLKKGRNIDVCPDLRCYMNITEITNQF